MPRWIVKQRHLPPTTRLKRLPQTREWPNRRRVPRDGKKQVAPVITARKLTLLVMIHVHANGV